MTLLAALQDAYQALSDGRPADAHGILDGCQALAAAPTAEPEAFLEWSRMRAMVYVAGGHYAQAERHFQSALAHARPRSARAGYVHAGLGALYGHLERRDEALKSYFAARDLFRRARDDGGLVAVTSNLAWSLLQVLRVDEAAGAAEGVLLAMGRAQGRVYSPLIHMMRSHVAALRGAPELAHASAAWACADAVDEQVAVRARHRLAQTAHLLGRRDEAETWYLQALEDGPARQYQPLRTMIALSLATLQADVRRLRELYPELLPLDQVRCLVHLAAAAWRGHQFGEAEALLRRAVDFGLPFGVASEELLLPDFFTWARDLGLPLPTAPLAAPRTVEIHVMGGLRLTVGGHVVSARLAAPAAALGAALVEGGPALQGHLARAVLGGGDGGAVRRGMERLCLLIGDAGAVTAQARAQETSWSLSERYIWTVNTAGPGAFLASLDTPWTREHVLASDD